LFEKPGLEWMEWLGLVGSLVAAALFRFVPSSAFLPALVVALFTNVLFVAFIVGLIVNLIKKRKGRAPAHSWSRVPYPAAAADSLRPAALAAEPQTVRRPAQMITMTRTQWAVWVAGFAASVGVFPMFAFLKGGPDWYPYVFLVTAAYCLAAGLA